MNKRSEDFVTKVLLFIKKARSTGRTLGYIQKEVKRQVDTLMFVTPRQKAELVRRFMRIARGDCTEHGLGVLTKYVNFVERRSQTTAKLTNLEAKIQKARKTVEGHSTGHGARYMAPTPGVFYLCSVHTGPAADHKEWQGRIYVDRFWRNVMEGARCTVDQIRGVEAYIRNHNILTVQEVVNHKPYLITRPYCRHFFIPLSTAEVLGSSLNSILKKHPEAHTRSRSKSRRAYRKQRERLLKTLS